MIVILSEIRHALCRMEPEDLRFAYKPKGCGRENADPSISDQASVLKVWHVSPAAWVGINAAFATTECSGHDQGISYSAKAVL